MFILLILYTMIMLPNVLRVGSYNCKGFNSSLALEEVRQLVEHCDVLFLQETWCFKEDLYTLKMFIKILQVLVGPPWTLANRYLKAAHIVKDETFRDSKSSLDI